MKRYSSQGANPNGRLQKSELTIKATEGARRSMRERLERSNPFKSKTCKEMDCNVMQNESESKLQGAKFNQILCLGNKKAGPCRETYAGESARSLKK